MLVVVAVAAAVLQVSLAAADLPVYKTPGLPVDQRVADLLSRMELDEKISQLILPFGAHYPQDYVAFNTTGLGATYPLPTSARNDWQRWQVNNTRLGIPTSFVSETLHSGFGGGTIFPMPSLQGCSWNSTLIRNIAEVIALEARVSGTDRGFSPVLHFCTDPRFGRCEESFSEDPIVISLLGAAAVTGLSGPGQAGAASTYLSDFNTKIATEAKHYAAYAYGGRDGSIMADISAYTLYDVYLRPWRAYAQAGGRAVMCSHNAINNMPAHGNYEILTLALRENFGFAGGLIASDAGDISSLQSFHIVPDKTHAGAWALNAGNDQELQFQGSYPLLPQALQAGLVNMSTIDRAVGNVLRQKIASGLLDGRDDLLYVNYTLQAQTLDAPAHRALARVAAEESIVLLKNDNNLLPLQGLGTAVKRVAVLGPNANNTISTQGGYTNTGAHVVTVLEGAVRAANDSNNRFVVQYSKGACLGGTPDCPCPNFKPGQVPCDIYNTSYIADAVSAAKQADVTLLVVGDSSTILAGNQTLHQETATCGEHFDRDDLDLPGAQMALLRAVAPVARNLIIVLVHGRTVTFGASNADNYNALFYSTPAVLSAWRPGEEAGNALWRILNGTVNPSGRTSHTWPRTVGQVHQYVPWYLPFGTRSENDNYGDSQPATPLIPFGFGLSYTSFTFSDAKLSNTTVSVATAINSTITLNVTVASKGPAGQCVVQVYFSQDLASRVRYQFMLLGFAKVAVPANSPGTVATVQLNLDHLAMWNTVQRQYLVEASTYTILVGQYSSDPHMQQLKLTVQ